MILDLLSGCCKPISNSELAGSYWAKYAQASEKLILSSDGHFTQEVTLKSTKNIIVATGTWTFDSNDKEIVFNENFMLVLNGVGELTKDFQHPKPRIVIFPVARSFGHFQIGSSPSIEYRKE